MPRRVLLGLLFFLFSPAACESAHTTGDHSDAIDVRAPRDTRVDSRNDAASLEDAPSPEDLVAAPDLLAPIDAVSDAGRDVERDWDALRDTSIASDTEPVLPACEELHP